MELLHSGGLVLRKDLGEVLIESELLGPTYPGATYTHHGWLTGDHTRFVLDDELDEFALRAQHADQVLRRDRPEALFVKFIFNSSTKAIDHQQFFVGNKIYQSNYRPGLRLLELPIAGLVRVLERGYFDVYPANDFPAFNGTWGNYPFLPSRNILVSSIEEGLYILRGSGLSPP